MHIQIQIQIKTWVINTPEVEARGLVEAPCNGDGSDGIKNLDKLYWDFSLVGFFGLPTVPLLNTTISCEASTIVLTVCFFDFMCSFRELTILPLAGTKENHLLHRVHSTYFFLVLIVCKCCFHHLEQIRLLRLVEIM